MCVYDAALIQTAERNLTRVLSTISSFTYMAKYKCMLHYTMCIERSALGRAELFDLMANKVF